jgi:hypothetical protein
MRQFPTLLVLSSTMASFAVVPNTFTSGAAAKADEVNANFTALDSAVQNRASKADMSNAQSAILSLQSSAASKTDLTALTAKQKADSATLAKAIPAPGDISVKADAKWVRDTLKSKADTLRVNGIATDVANLKATKFALPSDKSGYVRDEAGVVNVVSKIPVGDLAGVTPAAIGAQPAGSFWTHDTASMSAWNPLASETKIGGIRTSLIGGDWGGMLLYANPKGLGSPTQLDVAIDGDYFAQEGKSKVWHSGNLTPLGYYGNRGVTAFSEKNPPMGSWYIDPTPSENAPSKSENFQVISTGTSERGLQFASEWNWDALYYRRGSNTGWQGWRLIVHDGNFKQVAKDNGVVVAEGGTINGDLRISGKLTTNPGATPADYVFESDYKLASLSEVEAYTKANKHLPEVPSASEMTKNGVDLAAMNMVLLKKVEELTLHAIALQKDVEAQKALMADQQKAMIDMKTYVESLRKN